MINLYTNNPTKDQKDGTLISQDHTNTAPLAITLKLTEQKAVKVAVRTDTGYKTADGVNISFAYWDGSEYQTTGGNINNWFVCLDNNYTDAENALTNGTWGHSADITSDITDTNTIIWVKYDASNATTPINDDTTAVCLKATVEAV
ncbi:hypothetical protein SAMN02745671_00655 [Anaerovibrio lipolyticus DSM 3074]|uniref:Uncharacterized protein n=1 Tax=Anaerovibrio lipolyticus DSM 3074 TaxID=1120997 RepID=A0A1M6B7M8_9FIRM|nr:hypothetical protein [Anaerovibrio lipolyticus]SHI44741.1 hypothetical protein SAMN02745671_00655 [Anaerovibrio lipolyticus DSM 3074]